MREMIKLAILNLLVLLLFECIVLVYMESRLDEVLEKVDYYTLNQRLHRCKTKVTGLIVNGTLVFKKGGSAENIEFVTKESGLAISVETKEPIKIKNCTIGIH